MNTQNTTGATTVAVTNKEKIQGRKPRILDYVNKFVTKHGPGSKHGMRFNSEKGKQDIEAAIAVLNNLKAAIVIPAVPVVPTPAPTPVAPVAQAPTETPAAQEVTKVSVESTQVS